MRCSPRTIELEEERLNMDVGVLSRVLNPAAVGGRLLITCRTYGTATARRPRAGSGRAPAIVR